MQVLIKMLRLILITIKSTHIIINYNTIVKARLHTDLSF